MPFQRLVTNNPRPDAAAIFRAAAGVFMLATLASCASDGDSGPKKAPPGVFTNPAWTGSGLDSSSPTPNKSAAPDSKSERTTWAILLGAFAGPGSDRNAATLASLADRQGSMPGAFVEKRGEGYAALYGSYEDPGTPQARKDLAAARAVEIGGARPFEAAIMAAPAVTGAAGSTPEWDLRNVKQLQNARKGAVTLQVGIYGRSDGQRPSDSERAEYRKAAEEAVKALRDQGEPAYYFHGPDRSTITIGVFPDERDPRIGELKKRFPNNLLNGQLAANSRAGARGQPSFTVGVP